MRNEEDMAGSGGAREKSRGLRIKLPVGHRELSRINAQSPRITSGGGGRSAGVLECWSAGGLEGGKKTAPTQSDLR